MILKEKLKLSRHFPGHYPLWQGTSHCLQQRGLSTGYPLLDRHLKMGGWPAESLIEALLTRPGIGELRLFLPAIARHLSVNQRVAFIGLPYWLHPTTLRHYGVAPQQIWYLHPSRFNEQLWAMEQLLQSGHCLMVLAWQLKQTPSMLQLRKLQLAAKKGKSCGVVFRHSRYRQDSSPAVMRLAVMAEPETGLHLQILKQPGSFAGGRITLDDPMLHQHALHHRPLPIHIKQPINAIDLDRVHDFNQPSNTPAANLFQTSQLNIIKSINTNAFATDHKTPNKNEHD